MPITEYRREQRQKHLGSSDMAAVMGISPWQTAYDVWCEKTGNLEEALNPNDAMTAGSVLEPSVLDYAEGELGKLKRNQYRSYPAAFLGANIDAIVWDKQEPVESKTVALFTPWRDEWGEWGEAGTDQVPEHIIIQAHVHMICLDAVVCHVPALIGGRGFCMFTVEWNQSLADLICGHARDFWVDHVLGNEPPDGCPSLDVIKRVKREHKTTEVEAQLVKEWDEARAKRLHWEKLEKQSQAMLLSAMNDGESFCDAADYGDQDMIVTCFAQNSSPRCDYDKLKEDGLYEKYCSQGTHRVLRLKNRS